MHDCTMIMSAGDIKAVTSAGPRSSGLPGLPPGFPGSAMPGLHPGLGGLGQGVPSSAASLLAGLPPSSSAASALMAAHMAQGARMPVPPGLPTAADLMKKEEEERERQSSSKPSSHATPGPLSDERNVSNSQLSSLSE